MPANRKLQTTLDFPVRKSLRVRRKDKENHSCSSTNGLVDTSSTKKDRLAADKTHAKDINHTGEEETTPRKGERSTCLSPLTPSKRRVELSNTQDGCSPSKVVLADLSPTVSLGCLTSTSHFSPSRPTPDFNARRSIVCHRDPILSPIVSQHQPSPLCSPPKSKPVLSARRSLAKSLSTPRKTLSPVKLGVPSPRKALASTSPRKLFSPTNSVTKTPSTVTSDAYQEAKKALNTQQPSEVICRDEEISEISQFLTQHIERKHPGSLYVSGAPGTGKTAVIKHVMSQKQFQGELHTVFINSMAVRSSMAMYKAIANELLGNCVSSLKTTKSICSAIVKHITTRGKMILLVLDEMDQLDSRNQEVLYSIFEWPSLPSSRVLLIGIANALDLTDRILPRLHTRSQCKPQLLHFTPYTKEQIVTVLEKRLSPTPELCSRVLDKSAMMFCARKVSAVAGDMRKALDICRRSIEMSQLHARKQEILKLKGRMSTQTPISTSSNISPTPSTDSSSTGPLRVDIKQVVSVVDEVYGSVSSSKTSTYPLQQKLIICTLLLMLKSSKLKELTAGKIHDMYCRVCKKRDVMATDQSEFMSLCELLEARGLITIKRHKQSRQTKVCLRMDARELEFALQDKLLITSVLESGL